MPTGRPRKGRQVRLHTSVRVEPNSKRVIVGVYGSFQKWLDIQIKNELMHQFEMGLTTPLKTKG